MFNERRQALPNTAVKDSERRGDVSVIISRMAIVLRSQKVDVGLQQKAAVITVTILKESWDRTQWRDLLPISLLEQGRQKWMEHLGGTIRPMNDRVHCD